MFKIISSVAGGEEGGYSPHRPEEKNALSAHLRGLFAAIGVSNDF